MAESKYFKNPLSAYTHQYAVGMQQLHEAIVARHKGDMQTYYDLLPKAQETFLLVDKLWENLSDEDEQFFLELMGQNESTHG
jgi:hypothetical protein